MLLYDGVGSLISYEDGEGTLGVIVENAWQRSWTVERSAALVVWNDGTVSGLHRTSSALTCRTVVLLSPDE